MFVLCKILLQDLSLKLYSFPQLTQGRRKMLSTLNTVASQSGIWAGERARSHAFLLSPSVFRISESKKKELSELGFALSSCLLGLSQMAVIAYDQRVNYGGAWGVVRKAFSTGVPSTHMALQGLNVRDIPRLLKVDVMVDEKGCFKIAEIDGHNKHGVGYSTLAKRFREAVCPGSKSLPGVVNAIVAEVKRLGHSELKILYAHQERFYIPEFEIAKNEFENQGMRCSLVGEMEVAPESLKEGLFLDMPFLNNRIDLYEKMVSGYKERKVAFLIPPKPFFGAKGVLALLRNEGRDEQLEGILISFVNRKSLELIRRYIPETWFVGKQAVNNYERTTRIASRGYVLKESVSSGMKGVFFSDDSDFDVALRIADRQNMNWILQEEVYNQPQTFSWFENGEERSSSDWFMRVTVHYVSWRLADIVVTATQSRAVHGGKRCLQLGTVVE